MGGRAEEFSGEQNASTNSYRRPGSWLLARCKCRDGQRAAVGAGIVRWCPARLANVLQVAAAVRPRARCARLPGFAANHG